MTAARQLSAWTFIAVALLGASLALAALRARADSEPSASTASPASAGAAGVPVPIPAPSPQAVRYYHSGIVLWIAGTVWGLLVPALIFFSGLSARLRDAAQRMHRRWYVSLVFYFGLLSVLMFVVNLPLDYYSEFVRPHEYGLSSQALGKWWKDGFIGLALEIIGGALFLWIPFLLIKRAPRRWWLYTWVAGIPIMVVIAFVEPIWIEPLFNHFGPMQDKVLETRILALANRAGIEGAHVYEVDKSVDTNELNGYVTGIGNTKRIVLWDTLLKEFTPDEVAMVMGHEMGHYTLGHVWKGLLIAIGVLLVGLWLVQASVGGILTRFGARTGVHAMGDVATLPLFMLIFGVALFVLTPPLLAVSRHFEHEADRFGLEITHDNHACAMIFVKFVKHDLAYPVPSPLMEYLRASHPSLGERIDFCNRYHPWLENRAERYAPYFKRS